VIERHWTGKFLATWSRISFLLARSTSDSYRWRSELGSRYCTP